MARAEDADPMRDRFNELISREFSETAIRRPGADFSLDRALQEADPTPKDHHGHVPHLQPSGPPWSWRVISATTMLGLGLAVALLALFGVGVGRPVLISAALSAIAGLTVLLFSLPRHRRHDGDGARL